MNRFITLTLVGITIIALALGYNFLKVNMALEKNIEKSATLEDKLSKTKNTLGEVKKELDKRHVQINTLKKRLDELAYPARIKSALSAAQSTIAQLNKEMNSLRKNKDDLDEENISMKTRIQNNGREIVRLLRELQKSRKQFASITNQNKTNASVLLPRTSKKTLALKNKEAALLKKELSDIKERYNKLSYDKQNLKEALKKAQDNSASKKSSRLWQRKIKNLQDELSNKDREIDRLNVNLNAVKRKRDSFQDEINGIKNVQDKLRTLNVNLQNKLLSVSQDLDKKDKKIRKLETALNQPRRANDEKIDILKGKIALQNEELDRIKSLYNDLRSQLKDVAKIMSEKEDELAAKSKDIETLNDNIAYLKLKLSNMDEVLQQSKDHQRLVIEKLSEVTNLNKILQKRLGEVKGLVGESNTRGLLINNTSSGSGEKSPARQGSTEGYRFNNNNTSSKEKNDASSLKKRVEVILQPSQ